MQNVMRTLVQGGLLLLAAIVAQTATAEIRAYVGGTIIDGNGGTPIQNGVLVTDGTRIQAVGRARDVTIPEGAERIDVRGKYLLPGLMDANVHYFPWPSWTYIEFLARYEDRFEEIIEEGAQIALKYGVTSSFDSMGPLDDLVAVRDRINAGETKGSRLFVAGNIVGFRAVFTEPETIAAASTPFMDRINARFEINMGPELNWMSPERIYEEMTEYAQRVDFVKVGVTGDGEPINSEVGQRHILRFTPEQLRAMVRAVHEQGKIIQSHHGSAESLQVLVEAGFDMAQHCAHMSSSRVYQRTLDLMVEQGFYCGTQWAPLSDEDQARIRNRDFHGPDGPIGDPNVKYDLENAVLMLEAGIPHLMSTDTGTIDPDVSADWGPSGLGGLGGGASGVGEDHFLNMRAMLHRGMTPMQIVQAATRNVASVYRVLDDLGTLETGKIADVLILDANPLDDIENMRRISMVIQNGAPVDREALPLNPILTSEAARNPGPIRRH